jgi:PAS domain S-box-containing protein
MLEHEHSLMAQLDPTWAVRPMALADDGRRMVLVLEDPGGEPLDQLLGTLMDLTLYLRLAVGLSVAVRELHRRNIIHKDIKPANVIFKPSTGQVWLMGFGIASRFARERQSAEPPEFIAGTLAYMAPEQTGRMNRSIDSRADLYALGVTLYEAVTGTLPFKALDPIEWVHCHIAKQPVPPAERRKDVPRSVSVIIMKLLAKTAEERYQTAAGLERDLQRCLTQWETQHRIDDFPLGENDIPDRLLIPEKLYGRQREVDSLCASFERVIESGTTELALISGYSGIGKSSVVNALHKALVPPRGLFASGKCDQYKRNIPYSTLAQAFQSLIRYLLVKSEADLAASRDSLRDALDPNGKLIIDLIPDLKLIIGDQPSVLELPLQQAQARFQLVFRRFIGVFARPEHPLALFLDDMQWLDAATLDLLENLLTQSDLRYLMLIGAYRNNEVDVTHPLARKLEAIKNAGAKIEEITLAPLASEHLAELIAEALRCEPARAEPLAQLLHEKTGGNPFFALQFISALAEEGMLFFDYAAARWSWDLNCIYTRGYTDNVVDLMTAKLRRLSTATQETLKHFACLGNVAEVAALALVHEKTEGTMHEALQEAVRAGLIFPENSSYKFLHDRIQEAAYSLIPEGFRAEAHLRIGRLLVASTPPEQREEAIFEIVNQLNRGTALIMSSDEREQLAELNLIAGQRARATTAYASALTYLTAGAALLPEDSWQRRHELALALELRRAECEFLTGALAEAEQRLAALSNHAANAVERATVACLRLDLHTILGQGSRAIAIGLDCLRHFGIDWSPHPTKDEARREYERIWLQLGGRTIESLVDLPLMSDPASLATLEVLIKIGPPAFCTDANLLSLVTCHAVNLSLERGNCDASCGAYEWLSILAGPHFGDYRTAVYRFGELGYALVEGRGLTRFQARTYMEFGGSVVPWTKHVRAGRALVRRAFEAGNKTGDLDYAAYCTKDINTSFLFAGDPLAEAEREAEHGLAFAQKMRFGLVIDSVSTQHALIRMLRGLTPTFGCLDDAQFDERRIERRFSENPDLALVECWYWIRKLQARFFAGDYASAIQASSRGQGLLWTLVSLEAAEYHFYSALCQAASCDSAEGGEPQRSYVDAVAAHHRQLQRWAENCPDNFENRAALVGAERARIEGQDVDAMRLYEQAIRSSRANDFIHQEALAYELAARFYAAQGFEQIADLYTRNARDCYARWGADGKVRQLEELYPRLRQQEGALSLTATIGAPIDRLDLTTLLKVSQSVSGEIVLEKLIETLLRTAIEHAGAERGLLIMPRGAELRIQAEATTASSSVNIGLTDKAITSADLPAQVVQYTARAQESIILEDASNRTPFSSDEYIQRVHALSILCLPLVKQGTLIAVLYLENNLAANVFTPRRIAVLNVLASAAAISLENSRLYRAVQQRESRIRRLVDAQIIGIFIGNLRGEILEANDAFLKIVGYGRDDLLSGLVRWTDLTPLEWRDRDQQAIAELTATEVVQPYEKEYFRKDGSRVPVLIGAAVFERDGNEAVVFVLELTERKHAEEERERLRQAQAELAYMSRVSMMGELAASLAHEIKQPIAAAVMRARTGLRWLQRQPPGIEKAREILSRIIEDATRAATIVDRNRSLYKRETSKRETVNLNEVIRETIALLQEKVSKNSILIRTQLDDVLPTISADRVQVQQVLMNLILNGIEAMKETRGELTITSETGEHSQVLISVRDSGVGLPVGNPERIFEAFFTTKPEGTGMGLSISRRIIESHGGRLWASASPGGGAIFHFTLPGTTMVRD